MIVYATKVRITRITGKLICLEECLPQNSPIGHPQSPSALIVYLMGLHAAPAVEAANSLPVGPEPEKQMHVIASANKNTTAFHISAKVPAF